MCDCNHKRLLTDLTQTTFHCSGGPTQHSITQRRDVRSVKLYMSQTKLHRQETEQRHDVQNRTSPVV